MTGHFVLSTALLAGLLQVAPAAAGDYAQLAAVAGTTESEAAGMSLTELHARKINREARGDDRVTVSSRENPAYVTAAQAQLVANAGLAPADAAGMRLSDLGAAKANRDGGHDSRVAVVPPGGGAFDPAEHPQLLASAGLSPQAAAGMSLGDIYVAKINREARGDERQGTAE